MEVEWPQAAAEIVGTLVYNELEKPFPTNKEMSENNFTKVMLWDHSSDFGNAIAQVLDDTHRACKTAIVDKAVSLADFIDAMDKRKGALAQTAKGDKMPDIGKVVGFDGPLLYQDKLGTSPFVHGSYPLWTREGAEEQPCLSGKARSRRLLPRNIDSSSSQRPRRFWLHDLEGIQRLARSACISCTA